MEKYFVPQTREQELFTQITQRDSNVRELEKDVIILQKELKGIKEKPEEPMPFPSESVVVESPNKEENASPAIDRNLKLKLHQLLKM